MLIKKEDVERLIKQEKIITVVLKNNRNYQGILYYISEPNFDNDCLIEMKDRRKLRIKFKLSQIEILESQ